MILPKQATACLKRGITAAGPSLIAAPLIAGICYSTFDEILSYWFTGVDTFPHILSSQLNSVWEIPKLFTREILSAYSREDIAGSVSVRPVGMLLFSLDYWVWQLNPLGYHLTNLIIHTLNSILVFVFVSRLKLRGRFLVGLLSSVLFAIHPLHASTVPLIAARFDLLLCTFTFLTLIMMLRYLNSSRLSHLGFSFLFFVFTLGSKETGLILLPMVIFGAIVVRGAKGRKSPSLLPLVIAGIAIFLGYMTYRNWVLGGELGGYPVRRQEVFSGVLLMVLRFFGPLAYPVSVMVADSLGQNLAKVVVGGLGAALLLFVVVGAVPYLLGARVPLFSWWEKQFGSDLRTLFLVLSFFVGYFPVYVATYLLTGVFKPLYLYVPLGFWCVVLSALAVRFLMALSESLKQREKGYGLAFGVGSLTLPAVAVVVLLLLRLPEFRQFDDWSAAGRLGKKYLEAIESTISVLPDGATIFLINLPHGIECQTPPCIGRTYMFEDYSVDSWVRLALPGRNIRFIAVSTIWIDNDGARIGSRVLYHPVDGVITVQTSGGRIEPPWRIKSEGYLSTEIERSPRPRRVTIRIKDYGIQEQHYFFDFFDPRRILAIRQEGLVQPRAPSSDLLEDTLPPNESYRGLLPLPGRSV